MSFIKPGIFICFLLLSLPLYSGTFSIIKGRVTDSQTGEPLAFVHLVANNSRQGTVTDIDGLFTLVLPDDERFIQLSYVGYFTLLYEVEYRNGFQNIAIKRRLIELSEVVVYPGENPAHRIIRNTMDNRNFNDPERLMSFTYNSYNKFIATLEREFYMERWEETRDTNAKRLLDFTDKRHVFIMESVTERKFRYPNRNNEKIIANRVSGLQDPLFSMLATELQSFSFYGNYIALLDRDYLSPLSRSSFSRYIYNLEDTLYQGVDSVFVISFRPSGGTNFNGLKGLLYINNSSWAIQNVIAQPSQEMMAGLNFRIQQMYEQVDGHRWFPVQLNTDIDFYNPASGETAVPIRMLSRSYIRNITLNPPLSRNDFSAFGVDFDSQANRVEPLYWEGFRPDSLSTRERNTYLFMDSLGRAFRFDRILNTFEPLLFGEINMGIFSLPINRFYRYNEFEKHRIGLGLETNRRFSQRIKLGGHYAWGTGDKAHKYRYFGEVVVDKMTDLRLGVAHSYDITERGGSNFMERNFLLNLAFIRDFYTGTMDLTRRTSAYMSFRAWRNFLQTEISVSKGRTNWDDIYAFSNADNPVGVNEFYFTEAALRLRFAFGETLMNTPLRVLHLPSKYPVFMLNITKGFNNFGKGEFEYLKMEGRLDVNYRIPMWGNQSWVIESGWTNHSELPWSLLFTSRAGNREGYIAAPFSFGTMSMSEFIANRYFSVFFRHSFENLLIRTPSWEPELVLISNLGWGSLGNNHHHLNHEIKAWGKGYFESGIAINKIIPQRWVRRVIMGVSPGIELLYRYGPYSFHNNSDNLTIKAGFVLSL